MLGIPPLPNYHLKYATDRGCVQTCVHNKHVDYFLTTYSSPTSTYTPKRKIKIYLNTTKKNFCEVYYNCSIVFPRKITLLTRILIPFILKKKIQVRLWPNKKPHPCARLWFVWLGCFFFFKIWILLTLLDLTSCEKDIILFSI